MQGSENGRVVTIDIGPLACDPQWVFFRSPTKPHVCKNEGASEGSDFYSDCSNLDKKIVKGFIDKT